MVEKLPTIAYFVPISNAALSQGRYAQVAPLGLSNTLKCIGTKSASQDADTTCTPLKVHGGSKPACALTDFRLDFCHRCRDALVLAKATPASFVSLIADSANRHWVDR